MDNKHCSCGEGLVGYRGVPGFPDALEQTDQARPPLRAANQNDVDAARYGENYHDVIYLRMAGGAGRAPGKHTDGE